MASLRLPDHPWVSSLEENVILVVLPSTSEEASGMTWIRAMEAFWPLLDRPIGLVVDASQVKADIDARGRKMFADYEQRIAPYTKKYLAAYALIAPNPILRGVLRAISWLAPPVYPYRYCATLDEGTDWVRTTLRAHLGRAD